MLSVAFPALIGLDSLASFAAGLAMSVIGLALGIGPYYYALRARIRSYRNSKYVEYVITNRRSMILYIRDGKISDELTKNSQHIRDAWIKMLRSNGVGDVIWAAGGATHSGGDGPGYNNHFDVGFEGVADAETVLGILRSTLRETKKST